MQGLSSRSLGRSSLLENSTTIEVGLHDENLNVSAASQVGQVAGNSKAVLAALRALQDKIRRLDTERAAALDEAQVLRQQVKQMELEMEHSKQRDALASQRVLQEARVQQERLFADRADLEVRLARSEDRTREQSRQIVELEAQVQLLADDKVRAEGAGREAEGRARELDERLAQGVAREKGDQRCSLSLSRYDFLNSPPPATTTIATPTEVTQTMVWETKRHEDEVESLQTHIRALDRQLVTAMEERDSLEAKRGELEEVVSKLLGVNEKLAKSLSKATRAAEEGRQKHKSAAVGDNDNAQGKCTLGSIKDGRVKVPLRIKEKRIKRAKSAELASASKAASAVKVKAARVPKPNVNVPRCAVVSTKAAESARVGKSSAPSAVHWVPGGMRGVDHLHSVTHDLNASIQSLHSLHSQAAEDRHNTSHTTHASNSSNTSHGSRQAPLAGRERTYSTESAASADSRQSVGSARSTGTAGSREGREGKQEGKREGKRESPFKSVEGIALNKRKTKSSAASFWDDYDVLGGGGDGAVGGRAVHIPTAKNSSKSSSSSSSSVKTLAGPGAGIATRGGSPAMAIEAEAPRPHHTRLVVPNVGTADSFGKARDNDLKVVIQSLEEEFQTLNSQYRSLLKTVSSPFKAEDSGLFEHSFVEADEKEGLLVDVIQKLSKKGEQIRKLKSPAR